MMRKYLLAVFIAFLFFSCSAVKKNYATNNRINYQSQYNDITNKNKVSRPSTENSNAVDSAEIKAFYLKYLRLKYADMLGVAPASIINMKLMREIDDWYGTPYQYGGENKQGIDCSGFVQTLVNDVYNVRLPRTSSEQYQFCRHINTSELQEGDLVFFSSEKKHITHVGVYLQNGKFVHASTLKGVMISGLDEHYWQQEFVGAGRIRE